MPGEATMPDYQYTAREMSGREVTGILTATSVGEVAASLSNRQLFPVRIDLAEKAKQQQRYAGRRVRARHLAVFYTQLADLLRSGVPLLRSLELLQRQSSNVSLKLVLEEVRAQVADGRRLAEALRMHPHVFPELAVSMVRAGEEGSFLEDVLKRVSDFTEHQEELKGRVTGALAYPAFLLVVGTAIVSAMLVFFVPKFTPIFERLESQGSLPWATTALIALSDLLGGSWVLILMGMAGAAVLLVRYAQTDEGRMQVDRFRLRAFGIGPVVRSLAIARFCRILGTLLHNGVPILQSLRIAKDATGNRVLSEAVAVAAENISAGKALAEPLRASGQFPEEVVEMIAVGEEANNLEQVLINISENMERRTWRQLDLFVRLIEPVMLLVMAAFVLFVVAGLLLPVFQSSTAL